MLNKYSVFFALVFLNFSMVFLSFPCFFFLVCLWFSLVFLVFPFAVSSLPQVHHACLAACAPDRACQLATGRPTGQTKASVEKPKENQGKLRKTKGNQGKPRNFKIFENFIRFVFPNFRGLDAKNEYFQPETRILHKKSPI